MGARMSAPVAPGGLLTRAERRRIKTLAPALGRVTDGDARFFERFPERQHRVRLASTAEVETDAILKGEPDISTASGSRWVTMVKQLAPGVRLRVVERSIGRGERLRSERRSGTLGLRPDGRARIVHVGARAADGGRAGADGGAAVTALTLRTVAQRLGGEVQGRQVLAPGPGHSLGDRSLSVRLSHQSPTGFIVHSHSGDDFRVSRDYVSAKLGLGLDAWQTRRTTLYNIQDRLEARSGSNLVNNIYEVDPDRAARIARAVTIWNEAGDAHGTVVETYLQSRGLDLPDGSDVLRFHPRCPWRDEDRSETIRIPAMVACMRAIDADDAVTMGLTIGEGTETVLAARQLGFRPAWALGSAGAIAKLPILGGIEALTILAERDDANARAVEACARRWHAAGREVIVVEPKSGNDINDAIQGAA